VSPQDLVESPKGAHENVRRSSLVEHDDMHDVPAEFQDHHENSARPIVTLENSDGSLDGKDGNDDVLACSHALKSPVVAEPTEKAQELVILQRQEVHPSKNIQHGLDLWERVREHDARLATEASDDFMLVLTRNQKQKLKVQHVLSKKPSKSRARGDNQPPAQ